MRGKSTSELLVRSFHLCSLKAHYAGFVEILFSMTLRWVKGHGRFSECIGVVVKLND
uniref:Uncharacterized protein n=1 Tax=Anguilla anguilla TaxID=7936 RepID=A0A0E9XBM3_ANGAN